MIYYYYLTIALFISSLFLPSECLESSYLDLKTDLSGSYDYVIARLPTQPQSRSFPRLPVW